jgi:hypothetical protein
LLLLLLLLLAAVEGATAYLGKTQRNHRSLDTHHSIHSTKGFTRHTTHAKSNGTDSRLSSPAFVHISLLFVTHVISQLTYIGQTPPWILTWSIAACLLALHQP